MWNRGRVGGTELDGEVGTWVEGDVQEKGQRGERDGIEYSGLEGKGRKDRIYGSN